MSHVVSGERWAGNYARRIGAMVSGGVNEAVFVSEIERLAKSHLRTGARGASFGQWAESIASVSDSGLAGGFHKARDCAPRDDSPRRAERFAIRVERLQHIAQAPAFRFARTSARETATIYRASVLQP